MCDNNEYLVQKVDTLNNEKLPELNHVLSFSLASVAHVSFSLSRRRDRISERENEHARGEQMMGRCGEGVSKKNGGEARIGS